MPLDSELPLEADEADALDQRRPAFDDDSEPVLPAELPLTDADAADALDQHLTVPLDDDDWPI